MQSITFLNSRSPSFLAVFLNWSCRWEVRVLDERSETGNPAVCRPPGNRGLVFPDTPTHLPSLFHSPSSEECTSAEFARSHGLHWRLSYGSEPRTPTTHQPAALVSDTGRRLDYQILDKRDLLRFRNQVGVIGCFHRLCQIINPLLANQRNLSSPPSITKGKILFSETAQVDQVATRDQGKL